MAFQTNTWIPSRALNSSLVRTPVGRITSAYTIRRCLVLSWISSTRFLFQSSVGGNMKRPMATKRPKTVKHCVMQCPRINLNGTAGSVLLQEYSDAVIALSSAIDAVRARKWARTSKATRN
jgi:hypothetical protein